MQVQSSFLYRSPDKADAMTHLEASLVATVRDRTPSGCAGPSAERAILAIEQSAVACSLLCPLDVGTSAGHRSQRFAVDVPEEIGSSGDRSSMIHDTPT